MRTCKRYNELVKMYHFNPISECSLFENMETQHLYTKEDKKVGGMYEYIYWYEVVYEVFKNKEDNELFKKVELNKYDFDSTEGKLLVENGNFIVPEVVTSIGDECFKGCLTLTSIQLP